MMFLLVETPDAVWSEIFERACASPYSSNHLLSNRQENKNLVKYEV
jgi:hypothetical protein